MVYILKIGVDENVKMLEKVINRDWVKVLVPHFIKKINSVNIVVKDFGIIGKNFLFNIVVGTFFEKIFVQVRVEILDLLSRDMFNIEQNL